MLLCFKVALSFLLDVLRQQFWKQAKTLVRTTASKYFIHISWAPEHQRRRARSDKRNIEILEEQCLGCVGATDQNVRWQVNGLFFDWIYALIGFLVMLGVLGGIGITKPRGMSMKMWCFGYLAVALVFDVLVVLGLVRDYAPVIDLLLGLSAGAATGLAIHVMHHINEEDAHPTIMD